jgi:hypothetical protein
MKNILSYLLASSYAGVSALYGATAATCTVNGKLVECPKWYDGDLFSITDLFIFPIGVLMVTSMWLIFKKAGKPGWASIVPIYSTIVMLEMVKKPTWWIILYLIPFVNVVISTIVLYRIALAFGKSGGFTFGLIFLPFIFYPILAFGKSTYIQSV